MKRKGRLYQRIATDENLRLAFRKAAKGKHDHQEVIRFKSNFDVNMGRLQTQLLEGKPDIGHYRFFKVHDPKPRDICAASFPERILHHAVMNICEPILDAYAIHDSYACRKNKGSRKALLKAQKFIRHYKWYLKLDIQKYFDSIDHTTMLSLLSRKIKDTELIGLFQKIFDTYATQPGKGMPIGNLISQHLANFYLGHFDHWIKENRQIKAYVRYMDDFIIFADDKPFLLAELKQIEEFLLKTLALTLKPNIQLNRTSGGVTFLGYRLFSHQTRLTVRSRNRFIQKFKQYENNWIKGRWTIQELVRHIEPLIEFTKFADTKEFRRRIIHADGVSF